MSLRAQLFINAITENRKKNDISESYFHRPAGLWVAAFYICKASHTLQCTVRGARVQRHATDTSAAEIR